MVNDNKPVIQQVWVEQSQAHETRKELFLALEEKFNCSVVTFFTSFKFPVMIEDPDADIIEGILQKIDLSKGLILIISSPGGQGLAAERVINVGRSYS
ncbi:MAG: hypothetical protein HQK59_05735 [Deltaproteobacteria bacterium]|nr:hypothetical protein [Deltaproteobacteria bacterium]